MTWRIKKKEGWGLQIYSWSRGQAPGNISGANDQNGRARKHSWSAYKISPVLDIFAKSAIISGQLGWDVPWEWEYTRLEFFKKVWSQPHKRYRIKEVDLPQVVRVEKREKPARPIFMVYLHWRFWKRNERKEQRNRKETRIDLCYRSKTRRTMKKEHRMDLAHCVSDYKNTNPEWFLQC